MNTSPLPPESDNPQWWPQHVRKAFHALGAVLGAGQLKPEDLSLVDENLLSGHRVKFEHEAARERGERTGVYHLRISGPVFAGTWRFTSGHLERLARATTREQ